MSNVVMIIFMAFHFNGGATSEKIQFDTVSDCYHEKKLIEAEWEDERKKSNWGRRQMYITCVFTGME